MVEVEKGDNLRSSTSRYIQIKNWIGRRIDSGEYRNGQLFPTETELADVHRVSRITIRRALQALEKDNLAVHLPQKGFMVKGGSDSSVLSEPSTGIGRIGYVCAGVSPKFSDPYYMGIMEGIYGVTVQNKLGSPILYGADESGNIDDLLKRFAKDEISGVVLASSVPYARLLEIHQAVKHMVLADSDWQVDFCPRVTVDKAQGAYDLVRHLIGLGHKRIGFIGHVRNYEYALPDEREHLNFGNQEHYIDGYRKALAEAEISEDRRLIEHAIASGPDPEAPYWALRKMMQSAERPTAIFCTNDFIASKVINALNEIEFRIPDDIAVAAFDYMGLADYLMPKLTTVTVPRQQIGKLATSILIRWLGGKEPSEKNVSLPLNLIIRDSCGAEKKMRKSLGGKSL